MVPKVFAHYILWGCEAHSPWCSFHVSAMLHAFLLSRTIDKTPQPRFPRGNEAGKKRSFSSFNIKKNVVRAKRFNIYYSCHWQEEKGTSE